MSNNLKTLCDVLQSCGELAKVLQSNPIGGGLLLAVLICFLVALGLYKRSR